MKCDELKVYKVYTTRNEGAFGFCECSDPTDIELEHKSVCLKSDVDEAIAELKEKLHDVDNQWNEQCKEIAQLKAENESLKAKLEDVQNIYKESLDVKLKIWDRCKKAEDELESLKASHDTEMMDAGMRERRLCRALWLARAERADDRARIFYFSDLASVLDIDGFSYDSKKKKGCKKLTARLWRITWLKIERKCLKKAEEYR